MPPAGGRWRLRNNLRKVPEAKRSLAFEGLKEWKGRGAGAKSRAREALNSEDLLSVLFNGYQ